MLLDTASLYFRAFFGVPDTMKAADGTPTNAIRGLLDFIARLTENHRPTHLVACWDDNWRPSWRVALIPSYKAQRVEFVTPKGEQVEDVPGPARGPGAVHPRLPGGARHRDRGRARPRGRRRDRHAVAPGDRCRSTWSPATATCSS